MTGKALILKKGFVLLLPVLAAGAAWLLLLNPVLSYLGELDAALDSKREVLSRYQGLIAQRAELQPGGQSGAQEGLQALLFAAPNANAAAALLQQKLSALIAANGGQLRSARIEPSSKAGADAFAVNASFAVSSAGLSKLLLQMEGQKPLMFVEALSIKAGPALARLQDGKPMPGQAQVTAEEPVLDVSLTAFAFLLPGGPA